MILLHTLRAFFVLAIMAAGWSLVEAGDILPENRTLLFFAFLLLAVAIIVLDVVLPRKSLAAISGLFFGLVVGLFLSYGLSLVLNLLTDVFLPRPDASLVRALGAVKVLLGIICCYLCVSFILQTKDDIRFVIPYVEFARQLKGQRPMLLDTSVIIDGRIVDVAETGVLDQQIVVPRFVIQELQAVADSADRLKRNRGRRGLDALNKLQANKRVEIQIIDPNLSAADAAVPVDERLVNLAKTLNARVVTNDYNLNKVARVHGVPVINVNDLANALRLVVLPGESLQVRIIRPGEEPGQGVGYLDDGTMVVVEAGRNRIGESVSVTVTSVLQTSAGRMIFGRADSAAPNDRRRSAAPDG